jgi:hypothetical protein
MELHPDRGRGERAHGFRKTGTSAAWPAVQSQAATALRQLRERDLSGASF